MPHLVRPRSHHPQRIGGISCRAHCHHWCTRKNYHVNNKYKMELINYPTPRRERRAADNGDTNVATIGIVRNERSRSLSREDLGGRRQVPDGSARDSDALALTIAFAAAVVISRSTAGCRADASASHPLDSASASNAQRQPIEAPFPLVAWRLSSHLPLVRRLVVTSPVVACLCLTSPFVAPAPHPSSLDPSS